ncbi:MAG TPA: carbon-nitrogen hydrolase family protein [Candidatus Limnocylindrales bacterium]|nr:carbon-nitrogen hydrolase family protein [Candidatus Limnocylindrales bacterium]
MKFVAAAVQMQASDDKASNLAEAERWVHQATRQGARLVVLPEVFIWRGNKKLEREFAEIIPGATSNRLSGLARQLSIFLLAGSILEEIPASSKAYNTSLLFDPSGNLLATYRKIHLFDVDLANGVSLRESETRSHGEALVAAQTELGTMGLSVCYDLRFPELYRGLADQGAQLIFVPSAFTAFTGQAHWEPLLRARAIENQSYIIAADQFGKSAKSFECHGHSMIVDPWGTILAELPDGPGVITAEIDLDHLAKVRAELPALQHRRILNNPS